VTNPRYLAKGTSLKREADKSSRSDPVLAAVIATHAILNFISAFSCDDSSRKIRGKLALHENWKTTSEFIVWVINLVRDTKETELEGLWYIPFGTCGTYQTVINYMPYVHNDYSRTSSDICAVRTRVGKTNESGKKNPWLSSTQRSGKSGPRHMATISRFANH